MSAAADVGLHLFVGAPQNGKSSAALWEARAASRELDWPLLVIDSIYDMGELPGRIEDDGPPGAAESRIVIRVGKGRRASPLTVWSPPTPQRLEWLLGALAATKRGVVLLVDEWACWVTSRQIKVPKLLDVCRGWAHYRMRVFMTTQAASGDVPRAVRDCRPRWSIFNVTDEGAEYLSDLLRLKDEVRDGLVALPPGHRWIVEPTGVVTYHVVPRRAALPKRS